VNTDREDRRDVRAAYDAVARDYDAQFGRELDSRPLERGLLTAFIELAGRGVIADVGCGPGHVTRFLARQGADVIGIDLAPEMISVARERAPELPFVVGSMLDLPAEDGAWAGAVALYSIIHLTDDERARAFRELARVLQPNGRLLVSFRPLPRPQPDRAAARGRRPGYHREARAPTRARHRVSEPALLPDCPARLKDEEVFRVELYAARLQLLDRPPDIVGLDRDRRWGRPPVGRPTISPPETESGAR
jgi:SAM-dependent methyltransferase